MAFTPANREAARAIIARYPHKRSALLPLLHLAQDQDGWVTPEAMEEVADLLDMTPALVLGTASFYTMFKREPVGQARRVGVHQRELPRQPRSGALHHLEHRYADDADVTVEEVECVAACDLAPVIQVNYEFHGPLTPDAAVTLIDEYSSGARVARSVSGSPRTGE